MKPKPEDYIDLVYNLCKRYRSIRTIDVEYEDIVAVAKIELMKAIESYEPSRGKFGPYVNVRIRFGISDYLRSLPGWDKNKKKSKPHAVSLSNLQDSGDWIIDYDYIMPNDFATIIDVRSLVEDIEMDFKYKYVLRMLYINNFHINDLAKEMNCSDKYVFRLRLEAIRALQAVIFGKDKKS